MKPAPPLTAGRVVYLLYHFPMAEIRRSLQQGGPWQQTLDRQGRAEMARSAWELPAPAFLDFNSPLELHLLTGAAFAFQSLYCLWSFSHAAQRHLRPILYDDGTLTPLLMDQCRTVFPYAHFISHAQTEARVEAWLPRAQFPYLRDRFSRYPLIQKLINPHLGSTGWKLVLDSDVLFFRRPEFLLRWLAAPLLPLYSIDITESYGYSRALLEQLAGGPLPVRLNSGVIGLRSEAIDWEKLEGWCGQLIQREGSHYLLEQTLTALLLAGTRCAVAPESDYITAPSRAEAAVPRGVMHHYVHDSKRGYFRSAWRRARTLDRRPVLSPSAV